MSYYIKAWCDGSCKGNGSEKAIAGYGAIIRAYNQDNEVLKEIKLSGRVPVSTPTNQIAELYAAIMVLRSFTSPTSVIITTDSKYVINGISQWISSWKKNNWISSSKKPVANKEYWVELDRLCSIHTVTFNHVRGHTGDPDNEECDRLANLGESKPCVITENPF